MTGPEHYREAERLVRLGEQQYGDAQVGDGYPRAAATLAAAQVHATLALTAATARTDPATAGEQAVGRAWREALK